MATWEEEVEGMAIREQEEGMAAREEHNLLHTVLIREADMAAREEEEVKEGMAAQEHNLLHTALIREADMAAREEHKLLHTVLIRHHFPSRSQFEILLDPLWTVTVHNISYLPILSNYNLTPILDFTWLWSIL
uniref:Uncharacterized protein n=1 Tax=Cacopsylla melanoneura TaxID=428564 RepID=A0A8D8QH19_9HEMI